jgi:hypothetical protein
MIRCTPVAAAGALLLASCVHGAEPLRLEDGFVRLDNGKDLTDWCASKWTGEPTGDPSGWSVVDGAICLEAKAASSHLFCKKSHSANCIIRLQFRAAQGADSGLALHGKQFQVRDYPNSLADTRKYGPYTKPPGEWNDLELDVTHGVATIKLNGTVIEEGWKIGTAVDRGLGLQREKGDFGFRFIRIKEKD